MEDLLRLIFAVFLIVALVLTVMEFMGYDFEDGMIRIFLWLALLFKQLEAFSANEDTPNH